MSTITASDPTRDTTDTLTTREETAPPSTTSADGSGSGRDVIVSRDDKDKE